jgi:hypothetical protein
VVIPCLVVTAFVAVQLAGGVKPTYKAEGTVVFLRPLHEEDPATNSDNPWQTVDYALNQFALLMGQAAASDAFKDRVAAGGGSTNFSVNTSATQAQGSPTNQTPTLTLSVIADTPEGAMTSYGILGNALDQEVKDRQQSVGAAESTWITAVDLTVPPGAQELVGSRVTVLIAAVLAGTLVSLGLVFALDALLLARRHRREAAAEDRSNGSDDPDGVTDVGAGGGAASTTAAPVRLAPAPDPEPEPEPDVPLERPGRREIVDVDDLTLEDLIEDWPDEAVDGPHRPAIPGDGARTGDDVDEAVGQ